MAEENKPMVSDNKTMAITSDVPTIITINNYLNGKVMLTKTFNFEPIPTPPISDDEIGSKEPVRSAYERVVSDYRKPVDAAKSAFENAKSAYEKVASQSTDFTKSAHSAAKLAYERAAFDNRNPVDAAKSAFENAKSAYEKAVEYLQTNKPSNYSDKYAKKVVKYLQAKEAEKREIEQLCKERELLLQECNIYEIHEAFVNIGSQTFNTQKLLQEREEHLKRIEQLETELQAEKEKNGKLEEEIHQLKYESAIPNEARNKMLGSSKLSLAVKMTKPPYCVGRDNRNNDTKESVDCSANFQ